MRRTFFCFLSTFLVACGSGSRQDQATASNASDNSAVSANAPSLPDSPFNYANIELPEHYLFNDFSGQFVFQRAAVDLDNTPIDNPISDAGATLGRVLFYDKQLSANGTTACASCHLQAHGFSDPNRLSVGFEGGLTRRHSMGIANARFYDSGRFFWDERAETLEEQVLMPFQDPTEMGLSLEDLERIVADQAYYPELFRDAFGDDAVSSNRIALALAQFVRSIVSIDSRYDRARADVQTATVDFPQFTDQENLGKSLFFQPVDAGGGERVNCSACHISEAFVGPVPNGPVGSTNATNNGIDAVSVTDLGVFESSGRSNDVGKFKVPSLVNIAIRPPYMHDGRFSSLEEVIDHYSSGVQNHSNLSGQLRASDGSALQFGFSQQEKAALIAFLETLTDSSFLTDEKYSDPFQ